jgi:thiamine biosynthesis lipoprotein ApbE
VASRFRPDSEINALHRAAAAGVPVPVSVDLLEAVEIALRAARLSDGAVDPTVGTAMCRLGYDRDFTVMERNASGDLPEPGPVPGWQSVDIDIEHSTVALPVGTLLDLGATAKAWAADRAARKITSPWTEWHRTRASALASPTSVVTPPHQSPCPSSRVASPRRGSETVVGSWVGTRSII